MTDYVKLKTHSLIMEACYTNMYVASQNKNIITHVRPATLNRSDLKKNQVHVTHSLRYKL